MRSSLVGLARRIKNAIKRRKNEFFSSKIAQNDDNRVKHYANKTKGDFQ